MQLAKSSGQSGLNSQLVFRLVIVLNLLKISPGHADRSEAYCGLQFLLHVLSSSSTNIQTNWLGEARHVNELGTDPGRPKPLPSFRSCKEPVAGDSCRHVQQTLSSPKSHRRRPCRNSFYACNSVKNNRWTGSHKGN